MVRSYRFSDLVDAWLDAERYATAHPDLSDQFERRYVAFAAAFAVDLREPPDPSPAPPAWMRDRIDKRRQRYVGSLRWSEQDWARDVHWFVVGSARRLRGIEGPFSDFIEIDATLQAVREEFSPAVRRPLGATKREWRRMLGALSAALFPEAAERVVSSATLLDHGFDDSAPAPDPDDYW